MRGMDRLVQLRRDGLRPELLRVWAPSQRGSYAYEGDVLLEPHDHPATADLRVVHDLTVMVVGRGYGGFAEAEIWARAVCAAGARNVALAFKVPPEEGDIDGPAWIRINGEDIA